METDVMIRALKYTANKHKNDRLVTFDTNITAMCNDVIPKLELLKAYEDICPTPEKLLEIDKMYSDMCREVAELKRKSETKVEGDLISRKALLKKLKDYVEIVYECDFDDPSCTAEYGSLNPKYVQGLWEAKEIIEDTPIAYDVDKVVDALESLENDGLPMRSAIRFVKGGGVDEG